MTASMLSMAGAHAQDAGRINEIEKQLLDLYQITKATADESDIVSAGSVLVLQKDHLLMDSVDSAVPTPNVYRNGSIASLSGAAGLVKAVGKLGALNPFANKTAMNTTTEMVGATREFVAGEKFWVTKIDTHADGVTLNLLSDPIKDKRYHAILKFPFEKGAPLSADDIAGLVAEVVKIDSSDGSQSQPAASSQNQEQTASAASAPKTIALGQTRDQVIEILGAPAKVVQLGAKEIDVYSDMKITFLQNRVVDVN